MVFERDLRNTADNTMRLMRLDSNNDSATNIAEKIANDEKRDDAFRHIVNKIMG